ncbi:hypothetical protein K0M31_012877, partial [Melipona bicolor]
KEKFLEDSFKRVSIEISPIRAKRLKSYDPLFEGERIDVQSFVNRFSSRDATVNLRGVVYRTVRDEAFTKANVHANPYLDWISVRLLLD